LIWPSSEVGAENQYLRREQPKGGSAQRYCDRAGDFLFFASAGSDGILFGHPVNSDKIVMPNVVAWFPIEDELTDVAPNLREFIEAG
jgi:hypothetical protein